ncbi:MAG: hypothetical protein V3S01_02480 [Dehalococcoidia bacterium]
MYVAAVQVLKGRGAWRVGFRPLQMGEDAGCAVGDLVPDRGFVHEVRGEDTLDRPGGLCLHGCPRRHTFQVSPDVGQQVGRWGRAAERGQ